MTIRFLIPGVRTLVGSINVTGRLLVGNGDNNNPSFGWQSDNDGTGTGIYRTTANEIGFTFNGTLAIEMSSAGLTGTNAAGPFIRNTAASATNPSLVPDKTDENTGIGLVSADNLALIAGGLQAVRVEDPADLVAGETSLWLYDKDNNTVEQVTVGAAESGGAGFKLLRIPN